MGGWIRGVLDLQIFGQRLRGGQNVSREFWGGESVLQSVLSKTTFGGLRNWGWSGQRLFLLREMTESRQQGGGGGNVSYPEDAIHKKKEKKKGGSLNFLKDSL